MSIIIRNYWKYFKREYYESYLLQKKIRGLPLDEIKKIQWKRLKNLLNYVYMHNDFYKEYFDSVNIDPNRINSPSDFLKLPITEKKDYIKNFKKIVNSDIKKQDYIIATTSGSTGEPFEHYMDKKKELVNTEMAFMLNMESVGIDPFKGNNELVILFKPRNEIVNFKRPPKKKLKNRIVYSFFPESFEIRGYTITKENTQDLIKLIKDNKIKSIYGIASSILNLAQFIDNGQNLKLKYIITMGEELLDYQRLYISQTFKCPVFMDYGSSECMRMGFECNYHNGFHMDIFNYYFEFIKNEPIYGNSNTYNLIVTNLNNYLFPFIRYKTNDSVEFLDQSCNCGNNFPKVNKIFGKSIIGFTAPNGYRISSVDIAAFFEHYHKRSQAVRQFQVIQKDQKTMIIKIIPTEIFNEGIKKDIEVTMSKLVQGSMKIEVMPVDKIKTEQSGKTKVLILKEDYEKY